MAQGVSNSSKFGGKVQPIDGAAAGGYDPGIDGGYNPADFVISGTDHQGHNERIWARVQPQVARAISVVVKSGNFPFRTEGDLVRWAVVRGLKVLDKLEPQYGLLSAVDAINEILRQETYMQDLLQMFASMEKVISVHVADGAKGEARKLLSMVLGKVRAIQEPHWKKRCEADVMRRFGHLLEKGGGPGTLRPKAGGTGEDDE